MYGWTRKMFTVAELTNGVSEMNGVLEPDHLVGIVERLDLHRLDVRKYGGLPEHGRSSADDRFQLGRSIPPPPVSAGRGDGMEKVKTTRREP